MGAGFQKGGVDYVAAWRRADARLEADAIAMWADMGVLAPDVSPQARAKELTALAYRNGRLVGISTAVLQNYSPLRQRFAFMRMITRPGPAGEGVAVPLALMCREALRGWSKANPDEQVAGFAAIIPPGPYSGQPVLETGLTLVGYTDAGHQVRVFWWDHFRIPVS